MQRRLADLGEFGLIGQVVARFPQGAAVQLGPGDDAAVVAAPDGRVVAGTDVLVEGRHFRRDLSSGCDVGHKAAAANLADIAAMGAHPTALLVGLAAPAGLDPAWALDLADGLRDEAAVVGASVVGGDTVGADAVMVAVTALGDLRGRPPLTRGGARPGDVLAVAGQPGRSAAGLAVLLAFGPDPGAVPPPVRDAAEHCVAVHRRPEPPYAAGPSAAAAGATAMIDTSDGLVADAGHIAEASGVRIDLDAAALAPTPALDALGVALGVAPTEWVLTGGEDHCLLAAFPAAVALPPGWRAVGRVVEGAGVAVDGRSAPERGGWDHFG